MTAETSPTRETTAEHRRGAFAVLLIVLVLVCAVRVRLAPLPLERDEGEYAYGGQLALQGIPPFTELYNMKMPGIYWAYAAILAVFGQTPSGIHVGLLVMNSATVLLGYLLARRLFDPLPAALMASTYAWLSLGTGVMGMLTHAEHFVVFFVLLGLLCLPVGPRARGVRILLAGLFLGAAFTMKQHAAPFILYGAACLAAVLARDAGISHAKRIGYALLFSAGVLTPFLSICAVMWASGAFSTFWFWTFSYAQSYVSQVPLTDVATQFVAGTRQAATPAALCWIAALVGCAGLWGNRWRAIAVLGLVAAGLAGISPGFYFREHYYILLLPAIAALSVIGAQTAARLVPAARARAAVLVLVAAVTWPDTAYRQWRTLFADGPFQVSRTVYGVQPFPESIEIGRYLREHTDPEDRIAVLGSEPQIPFYAQRRSATPFVYMYPLMESHPAAASMQRAMIEGIERAMPKYVVLVNVGLSWLVREDSVMDVHDWYPGFLEAHYRHAGMFDLGATGTTFYWDEEMAGRAHYAPDTIDVFVRNDAAGPHAAGVAQSRGAALSGGR